MTRTAENRIGIIGGSGLYDIEGMETVDSVQVETPFGPPSDELRIGRLSGRDIVFLPRHGRHHSLLPSEINYRANIWSLKKLGARQLISVSAVGSLKKEIEPMHLVMVDQFVDRTRGRKDTFFGEGAVAHIAFSHPVCDTLRRTLIAAAEKTGLGDVVHHQGTYLNMEGPAFSTLAESRLYRSWGMDVIGMTTMAEARLAREAQMCFAAMAMVTDYDCWNEEDPLAAVSVEMIMENMAVNLKQVKTVLTQALGMMGPMRNCACGSALENAVMTDSSVIPAAALKRLEPLWAGNDKQH